MDIRTLYFAAMVVWLFSTCSLGIIWKIRKTYPGFGYWVLFSSGMTVGCIFLTYHDSLPQFIPILIGNGFLLVSVLWALQGVRTFYGTGHVHFGYWIALALVESGLAWFVYVTPNISVRVLLVSFFLGIVSIIIAWELIFNTTIKFRTSSRFFGVVVLGNGLFFIFRGFATVLWDPLPTFFSPSSIQAATLFAAMAISMLSAFGVIMLNSQRGEVELRKSEDRLKRSQEIAHLGSWELDLVQNRLMWSDEVYHIFGLQPQEFGATYEAFLDRVYPDDRASVDAAYSGSLRENHDTYEIEHRVVRKDNGEIRIVHEKCEHIRNATGKIIRSIGMVHDITERKKVEEEQKILQARLQRAEKMEALGTMAGGVAHDLNNALGVLVGYSELLLQNLSQENPLRRYAMHILKGGERAAAIIQDMLTLTRGGVLVSDVVNLNMIISEFLQTSEFEAVKTHHPGVKFKTSLDKDLLNIKCSPMHLSKTLMNLLSNAAEAITGLGEVLIRTENCYVDRPIPGYDSTREGEYAVLTVSDTGSGISSADLGRIFEPFYTKKVMGRSGTGLGLAVVWGTIKDHNGYIDVQSKVGAGSVFTLYFPVTRKGIAKVEEVIPQSTYVGQGEHILVIDDVEGQRFLASNMLESLGYKVDSVTNGEEAVEFVENQSVDLLILDMIMDPGIDGLETYRRILEIRNRQKAIIVSGFAMTERVRQAQELGAGEYVKKPYLLEKIGLAVRKELDRI
jgi:PAS domain S-box-containing protein